MSNDGLCKHLFFGALAGLAGTLFLDAIQNASQKVAPGTTPPIRDHPGKFMVNKAKQILPEKIRQKIPEKAESAATKSLGIGYGMTFGALYAAMRPKGGKPLTDGVALGLLNWAVGFLGWLPATGLMPPVWKHKPRQIAAPLAQHAVFGAATVAAYDLLVDNA